MTPYGGLVDLSGVLRRSAEAVSERPNPFAHIARIATEGGPLEYFGETEAAAMAKVAAYCRDQWRDVVAKAGTSESYLTDEALVEAYFAHHQTERVQLTTTTSAARREAAAAAAVAPAAQVPGQVTVYVGVHSYEDGSTTYADVTEAGLDAQIADAIRVVWSEVEGRAGPVETYPDNREAIEAYFTHSDEDSLERSSHVLPVVAPKAATPEGTGWRTTSRESAPTSRDAIPARTGPASDPRHRGVARGVAAGETRESYWEWLASTLWGECDADEDDEDMPEDTVESWAKSAGFSAEAVRATLDPETRGDATESHEIYTMRDWSEARMQGLTHEPYRAWLKSCLRRSVERTENWLTTGMTDEVRDRIARDATRSSGSRCRPRAERRKGATLQAGAHGANSRVRRERGAPDPRGARRRNRDGHRRHRALRALPRRASAPAHRHGTARVLPDLAGRHRGGRQGSTPGLHPRRLGGRARPRNADDRLSGLGRRP